MARVIGLLITAIFAAWAAIALAVHLHTAEAQGSYVLSVFRYTNGQVVQAAIIPQVFTAAECAKQGQTFVDAAREHGITVASSCVPIPAAPANVAPVALDQSDEQAAPQQST